MAGLLVTYSQALLSAPNPDDPLDNGVAELWKTNEAEAVRRGNMFMAPRDIHSRQMTDRTMLCAVLCWEQPRNGPACMHCSKQCRLSLHVHVVVGRACHNNVRHDLIFIVSLQMPKVPNARPLFCKRMTSGRES